MIVRQPLKCLTCGEPRIARIQIGHQAHQEHTFACSNCSEPIKIGLNLDQTNASYEVVFSENCEPNSPEEGAPIYLCPDFAANKDLTATEFYFPSITLAQQLTEREIAGMVESTTLRGGTPFRVTEQWPLIQRVWRLETSGKHNISSPLITAYARAHQIEESTFRAILWHFLGSTFHIGDDLFREIRDIAKSNIDETRNLLFYYNQNLRTLHRKSYFDLLSDYFANFSEHGQVFRYTRQGLQLPPDLHVTSVDFDRSKSFYARSFEFFAGALATLTALNNIKAGRRFNQLQAIDIDRYLETDKAKRRGSISGNPIFMAASEEFDSQVRNATFHNHFILRPDGGTIEYRTGGTGAVRTMSYTQYLLKCGYMTRQLARLLCAELLLDEISCATAFVHRYMTN